MSITTTKFALSLLLLLCSSATALAQSARIQGIVVDAQGGVIADARVTAFDEAKQIVVREGFTANDGSFQLMPLSHGTYTVKAESSGFKALDRKGLVLDPYQAMNLGRLLLEVGEVTQSISVEAQTPLVETASAMKSWTISSEQVRELSLNGRDFQSLMKALPGVVSNTTSDFQLAISNTTNQFNVNGLRGSHNNVFLDGSINTEVGGNNVQYTQISLDAVGEFKVQTSAFNAEYGRNAGVMISATTRSFHGTAYEAIHSMALCSRAMVFPKDSPSTAKIRSRPGSASLTIPSATERLPCAAALGLSLSESSRASPSASSGTPRTSTTPVHSVVMWITSLRIWWLEEHVFPFRSALSIPRARSRLSTPGVSAFSENCQDKPRLMSDT